MILLLECWKRGYIQSRVHFANGGVGFAHSNFFPIFVFSEPRDENRSFNLTVVGMDFKCFL